MAVQASSNRWAVARDNSWARSLGLPELPGKLRVETDDFYVRESLRFQPGTEDFEGKKNPHWLLKIEKHGIDTLTLQRQLAERTGAPLRDIGYAGLKDKYARTEQWVSLPSKCTFAQLQRLKEWQETSEAKWRMLDLLPQRKKLARGANSGNSFELRLRDVFVSTRQKGGSAAVAQAVEALQQRVDLLRTEGFPNYFGEQRFGLNANNLPRALSSLHGDKRVSRTQRSLFISSLRSFLFNEYLHQRVCDNTWSTLQPSDALVLNGRSSFFRCKGDETEAQMQDIAERLVSGDLHIGGPMFGGDGAGNYNTDDQPTEAASERTALEAQIASANTDIIESLGKAGVDYAVRALRVMPVDLNFKQDGMDAKLAFYLPSGSFATALLRELFNYSDVSRTQGKRAVNSTPLPTEPKR